MRAFLNAILAVIGATSLTDGEFATVEATVADYTQATYDDLARILEARESVSLTMARLLSYYEARGALIEAWDAGKTNIFIGAVLD
mgnify:CR=1 FL=1|jgi:hypothetical protein